jgi:hypothetical protein
MTEQRTGLLEADMSRVRHWIDTAVRHAVNEAAQALNAVRYWCDTTEASTREWMQKHNPECECEVGETYLNAIAQVRALLPDLPAVPPERRADSGWGGRRCAARE